jgi:hypothetical protein
MAPSLGSQNQIVSLNASWYKEIAELLQEAKGKWLQKHREKHEEDTFTYPYYPTAEHSPTNRMPISTNQNTAANTNTHLIFHI